MKLIVGLGNPEPKYMMTRHNAGFWVVDQIATTYGASYNRASNLQSDVSKTSIDGNAVVLAKPITYMNLSGRAVQSILHWYKISTEDCLIVHDDVSLPLGKIRLQEGGGAGGQHGIENIIDQLGGNKAFNRLKVGVGPDPGGDRRADYVLSAIPESESEMREKAITLAKDAVLQWLCSDLKTAANKFNGVDLRPKPEPPPKKEKTASTPSLDSVLATDAAAAELNQITIVDEFDEEEELEAPPPP
jgi:PTH1 family peptidyl-tRNA hydrolase